MAKDSKLAAGYAPAAKRDRCRTCAHWRQDGSCTKVAGAIAPDATCAKHYEKAS